MKRPLAYITAAWSGDHNADSKQAAQYCRAVYEAGFSPICPPLYGSSRRNEKVQQTAMRKYDSRSRP